MALDVAAIFADDEVDIPVEPLVVVSADDPVEVQVEPINTSCAAPWEPWPIVEGTEHYQVFVPDDDSPWPEFIPGYHYDFRQPSRLLPLLSRTRNEQ